MVVGEKLHPMTRYVTVKSRPFRRRLVLLHLDYAGLTCDYDVIELSAPIADEPGHLPHFGFFAGRDFVTRRSHGQKCEQLHMGIKISSGQARPGEVDFLP